MDWKTLCCAHQLTEEKEDAVSCWRRWSLFLELLLPAIIEYLSKRPKKNTVFLRILIHSASFSWLFLMWLLAEWKYQEPSTSRKKRNKRNILKEKIFCKFNGLWQFGIALLSDAFFVTENILFFYFLLRSDVSLTKFLWKQKISSFSSVREIHHQNDRLDSKNCYPKWSRTFYCIQFDRFMISLVLFLILFFLTKNSSKQYEEICQTNYCNLIFYGISQVPFLQFFRFHNSFLPQRSQNVILQPNKTVPPN